MQIRFNNQITKLQTTVHEKPNRIDPQGTDLRSPPANSCRVTIPDNEHRQHGMIYTQTNRLTRHTLDKIRELTK